MIANRNKQTSDKKDENLIRASGEDGNQLRERHSLF